ncbi:MAG: hypothetical protein QM768_02320 [Agriterribacter sp.]
MGRKAIYHLGTIDYISGENPFKKLSLYFDKIVVPFNEFKELANSYRVNLPDFNNQLSSYLTEIEFLNENGLIEYYDVEDVEKQIPIAAEKNPDIKRLAVNQFLFAESITDERIENDYKSISANPKAFGYLPESLQDENWKDLYKLSLVNQANHLRSQVVALIFSESSHADTFIAVIPQELQTSSANTTQHLVTEFILRKLPEPSFSTSWEQIIDFRSDPDVRNKYLSLITWINKGATTEANLKHFFDEYEYLYSEYMKSFNLHKMQYNDSFLSVFINSVDNFTSSAIKGRFLSALKGLLSFREKRIEMLEAETKLIGREISYIFHATEKFGK